MIVDSLLYSHFVRSAPTGGAGPCITVEEAKRLGLVPPGAIVVGDPGACIGYTLINGHPVVFVTVEPMPLTESGTLIATRDPTPPGTQAWTMNGEAFVGEFSPTWTGEGVSNEIAAGYTGAIMDCFELMDREQQLALMSRLENICDFPELPPMEEIVGEGVTMIPPTNTALYECVKTAACLVMEFLAEGDCFPHKEDVADSVGAMMALSEYCQHPLSDALLKFLADCKPWEEARRRIEREKEIEPEPGPSPEPGTRYLCVVDINGAPGHVPYRVIALGPGEEYYPTAWETILLMLDYPGAGCPRGSYNWTIG